MRLGVVADDFTGATDIAGFLVENGMSTVMYNGMKGSQKPVQADALVVSLKIRSCPVQEAVRLALEATQFLEKAGCDRFYYKYCSTFDSTPKGNIGQVVDAMMDYLGCDSTIICPALPVNWRTVYQGYLFVGSQLLNESSMHNHPVTPMRDAKLCRLMEGQFRGRSSHIFYHDIMQGEQRVRFLVDQARKEGISYLIVDALDNDHLEVIAKGTSHLKLVTGGSGLAIGIARKEKGQGKPVRSFVPCRQKTVILAGSCSRRTNEQVAAYRQKAAAMPLDVARCITDADYAQQIVEWVLPRASDCFAPLVYATKTEEELEKSNRLYPGEHVSQAIEHTMACVAKLAAAKGVRNFIVAGGETAGTVVDALGLDTFLIGPQIDPGVSWIRTLDGTFHLALKSGNFGSVDFFTKAQKAYDAGT